MSRPKIQLRPATDDDRELLYQIYASTRHDELLQVPWADDQKESFLRFQFGAQRRYYLEHFPQAAFHIVVCDDQPVGRLYVDRRSDEIRLIDIALLTAHRGRGIGSRLLDDLLAEGQREQLLVRIHVEQNNPAMSLYRRLGFRKIEDQGVYDLMEWTPKPNKQPEDMPDE